MDELLERQVAVAGREDSAFITAITRREASPAAGKYVKLKKRAKLQEILAGKYENCRNRRSLSARRGSDCEGREDGSRFRGVRVT